MKQKLNIPKISIITPSYNQARYLDQTIRSIVNQKYPNIEYFIMDGASTDNSVAVMKKYARANNYITWESKKDKGQTNAINKGLSKVSGDIIAYINSDDYYLPGTFKKVVKFFNENPDKLWLVGNCKVTKKNLTWTFFLKHLWPIESHRFALESFNTVNQPAVFLRKSLVKKVGKFNENYHYAFDYEYWLRCLNFGLPGRLKQDLAVFRVHDTAKGSTAFYKQFEEDLRIAQQHTINFFSVMLHHLGRFLTVSTYKLLK